MIKYVKDQIKKLRTERGLSQSDLAVDLGLTQNAYSKIENGKAKLDLDKLLIIANSLEVNVLELLPRGNFSDKLEETQKNYGYASKADIDDLIFIIKQLRADINALQKEISKLKPPISKKKK